MARETRRQRRDARRAAGEAQGAPRAPRVRTAGPAAESALEAPAPVIRPERRGLLGGLAGFVGESWAELRKVDWPNRSQVVQGTVIVLIACLIVGAFLYGADEAIRPFVRDVLLGK